MQTNPILSSILLGAAQLCSAQLSSTNSAVVPTLSISHKHVVQGTVEHFPFKDDPGVYLVRWTYTEEGARRIRDFGAAHVGQQVRKRVGSFETPPRLVSTNGPAGAAKHNPEDKQEMLGVLRVDAGHLNSVLDALKKK